MNLELVEQLVALVSEYPVSEIEVVLEGRRIAVRRPLVASAMPAPAADPATANPPVPALLEVAFQAEDVVWTLTAPMVGIFHHAAALSPDAVLRAGQVIASIESMKLMNDVAAERSGRITEVVVDDGAPVEYGQTLLRFAAV